MDMVRSALAPMCKIEELLEKMAISLVGITIKIKVPSAIAKQENRREYRRVSFTLLFFFAP